MPLLDEITSSLMRFMRRFLRLLLRLLPTMHKAGKFEFLNVAEVDGPWHYRFSGVGEAFRKAP